MSLVLITIALCLAFGNERSFVEPAPVNEGSSNRESTPVQDSSVKELESLKHSIGKTLAMMKTQSAIFTEANGERAGHAEKEAEVREDGKLVAKMGQQLDLTPKQPAKLKTELDVPAKNLHSSFVQEVTPNGNRRSGNADPVDNTLTTLQYSPLDMAEYVFWTGDEKGVTVAIEEFLQEGLINREEAISFLQEIKYNLDYLKNHYGASELSPNQEQHSRNPEKSYTDKSELKNSFELSPEKETRNNKKRDPEVARVSPVMLKANDVEKAQDEDYDELLERLRLADFLYTEYSLEEVIYQLAKVMFTQSLTRGNAEAQQALQKFTNFLETEAEQGHISRALEKKVLDVLIASLSDTLSEHPELLSRDSLRTSNSDGHFLRQILDISPEDKIRNGLLADQNLKTHLPIGIGKYKNP